MCLLVPKQLHQFCLKFTNFAANPILCGGGGGGGGGGVKSCYASLTIFGANRQGLVQKSDWEAGHRHEGHLPMEKN